ncbi:MAG TPA: DMT family transporter [Paenalcaligenes sp.]|nr:DMT family transporter [Paenalcaligenes sp.]
MWIPFLFVFLFSTGFSAAEFGVRDAGPFMLLLMRSLLTMPLLLLLLAFRKQKAQWGNRRSQAQQMGVGVLLHGAYLGGVFAAIQAGMAPGVTALLVTMHPLLTAVLSKPIFGVKLSAQQWLSFLIGAVGAALVLGGGLDVVNDQYHLSGVGLVWCLISLVGISFATLWQKKMDQAMGQVEGLFFQYFGAFFVFLLACLLTQDFRIEFTLSLWLTLAWLVLAISIGAIWFLMIMLKRGEAHQVARMFFLVPPLAALQAWILFGEQWNILMLIGAVLILGGLLLGREKKTYN